MKALLTSPDCVTRVALFGVRFRDAATGHPVHEGLTVSLHPEANPSLRISAFPTRGGSFALQQIPGLGSLDRGSGDRDFWIQAGARRLPYVVVVTDPRNRFQPFSFRLDLPIEGFHHPRRVPRSPAAAAGYVPLFSAPGRLAPHATAVLRAELRELGSGRAATRALVRVDCNGVEVGLGFSDDDGKVAVMFPYPAPARPAAGSPPGSPPSSPPRPTRELFAWDLTVTIHYSGWGSPPAAAASAPPDLDDFLAQRDLPPARALQSVSPLQDLGPQRLLLGRELVVRTQASSPQHSPYLFISPA